MYSKQGLEFACDELAEVIDGAQGVIDVEKAITDLIAIICKQDEDVVAETFRSEMLEHFASDEMYQCDPATFADNSQWAHELDEDFSQVDVLDLEDDLISLSDLDECDDYK